MMDIFWCKMLTAKSFSGKDKKENSGCGFQVMRCYYQAKKANERHGSLFTLVRVYHLL